MSVWPHGSDARHGGGVRGVRGVRAVWRPFGVAPQRAECRAVVEHGVAGVTSAAPLPLKQDRGQLHKTYN